MILTSCINPRLLAWTIVLVQSLAVATPFGTVNGKFGQRAEHEKITRAALACPAGVSSTGDCFEPNSITELAGGDGTVGAVGSPDVPTELSHAAHCDDADYLDVPGYPQSRANATRVLQECIDHLRERTNQGLTAAEKLLNSKDSIIQSEVEGSCIVSFASGIPGTAKCNALEGFGRALHGIQDFYSHSNWVDVVSGPISVINPPGLGLSAPCNLLNLRSTTPISPPQNLSTGCFAGPLTDETPGENGIFADCRNRITHHTMNKDTGVIDPVTGATSDPTTSRGQMNDNFERAVHGAIIETRQQWSDFQEELKARYGARRASLMICALTRDDPMKSCAGLNSTTGNDTDTTTTQVPNPTSTSLPNGTVINNPTETSTTGGSSILHWNLWLVIGAMSLAYLSVFA